jgi:hypothetical protein
MSVWSMYSVSDWVSQSMPRTCVSVCKGEPCVRQMSCKWVEFVAHLYIGRWIVFINYLTSENIVMISSSHDAEAAKSSI